MKVAGFSLEKVANVNKVLETSLQDREVNVTVKWVTNILTKHDRKISLSLLVSVKGS